MMRINRLSNEMGIALLELLLVIAIIGMIVTSIIIAWPKKGSVPGTTAAPPVVGATTTIALHMIDDPVPVNGSGIGVATLLLNPPPSGGVPTVPVGRMLNLSVQPLASGGPVNISPSTAAIANFGGVTFTINSTNYEGPVLVIAQDAISSEFAPLIVTIK